MTSSPKVTVIIPAYNAEKYISKAIESILNQTFQDFELLIINDCSTDGGMKIVQQFEDKRISIIPTPTNTGSAGGCRNYGLAVAQGQYIAFLDADDWAYPERLAAQVDFLDKNPHYGLTGTWTEVFDSKYQFLTHFNLTIPDSHLAPRLLFHNCFAVSSIMLRRNLVHFRFDGTYSPVEDYELWTRIAPDAKVANIHQYLVGYLEHEGGISKTQHDRLIKNARKVICNQLLRLGISPTEAELELHQQIAHLDVAINRQNLRAVNDWLVKLKKANETVQVFDQKAMNLVLSYYWFRLCSAHSSLGSFTILLFINSPLTKYLPLVNRLKLCLHCLSSKIKIFFK